MQEIQIREDNEIHVEIEIQDVEIRDADENVEIEMQEIQIREDNENVEIEIYLQGVENRDA